MLMEAFVVLGVLFLLVLILAPVIAYFNREKAQDQAAGADKTQAKDQAAADDD